MLFHQRYHRYFPLHDYLPGPLNRMANGASCLWHLSDNNQVIALFFAIFLGARFECNYSRHHLVFHSSQDLSSGKTLQNLMAKWASTPGHYWSFSAFRWVLNAITHTMASSLSVVSGPIRKEAAKL
jgi:hypothetical protein